MPDEYQDEPYRTRLEGYALRAQYYQGNYRKQLKVRELQADDNLGINFVGLVVDRSISMLLGDGIGVDFGENEKADDYIETVYRANKSDILFNKAAQFAGIYGTGFLKIIPEGATLRGSNPVVVPRLIALDPQWVTIQTLPEDIETVASYTIRYNVGETARKQTIERNPFNWTITDWQSDRQTSGRWIITNQEQWPYEFPPMLHWQNLPQPGDVYGQSDIQDVIELQDRTNFVASNISKIIRYHAHPKTWGRNAGNSTKASWGADEMILYNGPDALIQNLEMQSDLSSSQQFLMNLRQAIFDISRTVDITSVSDKLGTLTNFGLRVLFIDALNKLSTKQALFGEALEELNHRLLVMANIEHDDGGQIVWPDPMPVNEQEEVASLQADLSMGIISKQTAAKKRNYDPEQEQELMAEERGGEENLGSMFLQKFMKGQ
jgi:hypothetical protein